MDGVVGKTVGAHLGDVGGNGFGATVQHPAHDRGALDDAVGDAYGLGRLRGRGGRQRHQAGQGDNREQSGQPAGQAPAHR